MSCIVTAACPFAAAKWSGAHSFINYRNEDVAEDVAQSSFR